MLAPPNDLARYLVALASLTDVNIVKRSYRKTYLPLRQLPASIAVAGCGFALEVDNNDTLGQLTTLCADLGIAFRVYRIELRSEAGIAYVSLPGATHDLP